MAEVHSCVNKTFITIFIGIAIGFFIFGAWLLITGLVQIGQENYSYISILCIVCSIFPMIGGWIILHTFFAGPESLQSRNKITLNQVSKKNWMQEVFLE